MFWKTARWVGSKFCLTAKRDGRLNRAWHIADQICGCGGYPFLVGIEKTK
jgi:hypothetical protein